MERVYRNPRHLEKMSQEFARIMLPEAKRRRSPSSRGNLVSPFSRPWAKETGAARRISRAGFVPR
jgi:hypothetical protein